MKKIAYDAMRLDASKIVEDSKCCLKVNAVISKAGVYLYEDGWAFKPKMELLKAANAIRYAGAKLTLHKHPDSKVVMSQSQLHGGIEKPFFDRDRIRAVINFDKALTPKPLIQKVRDAIAKHAGLDVSIGFYYNHVPTPGMATDVNTGKQRRYDYVMRDILIDHVAVMFHGDGVHGRCTFPNCGIGVDTMMRRIALDPFAGYKNFEDCVSKNQDKSDPEAYCATIKREVEGAKKQYAGLLTKGGKKMKKTKADYPLTPEDISPDFEKCVAQRMADGYTRGEAEELCHAPVEAEDEPTPPGEQLDQEEEAKVPEPPCPEGWHEVDGKCVKDEAKPETSEDQEEQTVESTPLERCIQERVDAGDSEEEARVYCEAELAGEHEAVDSMLERGSKLLRLKQQRDIERRRAARRHPL